LDVAVPALNAFVGGLTGDQGLSDAFTDSEKKAFEWGERVRGLFKTVIAFKDELIVLGAVIGSIFVVSKISAGVAATIAVIKSLIIAYNALKASAIVAGIAAAFALNPLLGVGAVAAAAVVMAAAVKLAGTSDIDVDALGVATGSSNFTPFGQAGGNGSIPSGGGISPRSGGISPINPPKIPEITLGAAERISSGEDARDRRAAMLSTAARTSEGENARDRIVVNIGVAGDPEATARVITETLNNSFYRGTRGAGLLQGVD
jgi:hypothetical protein